MVNSVEIPTQVHSVGPGHSSTVVATNIRVNSKSSVPEQYSFPEDSVWQDEQGIIHGNEALIDKWTQKEAKNAAPALHAESHSLDSASDGLRKPGRGEKAQEIRMVPWGNTTYYAAGVFAGILIFGVSVWYYRRFSASFVLFILSCPFSAVNSGCNSPSATVIEPTNAFGTESVMHEVDYSTNDTTAAKEVLIRFHNKSNHSILLPEEISTSCGCTQATWSRKEALPMSTVEMRLRVSKPSLGSPRHLSATSEYFDADGKKLGEVVAYLKVNTDEEWKIVDSRLEVEHSPGKIGVGRVLAQCSPGGLPDFEIESSIVRLTGIEETVPESGLYSLEFQCDQCSSFDTDCELGELLIRNKGRIPSQIALRAVSRLRLPYKISNRAVVLPGNGIVTVSVEPGWVFSEVLSTSPGVEVRIKSSDNPVSLSVSSINKEAISCAVVGKVSKEGFVSEFRIPVLVSH
jgi:hypothetical protein